MWRGERACNFFHSELEFVHHGPVEFCFSESLDKEVISMRRRTPVLYYIVVLCLAAFFINIGFSPAARAADSQSSIAQEFEKIKPQFVFEASSLLPRIIFEAETDNSIDLYFCSPDRKTEALTDRSFARYPSPSADGQFVFYQDSEKDPFRDADALDPAFDPKKRDPCFFFKSSSSI